MVASCCDDGVEQDDKRMGNMLSLTELMRALLQQKLQRLVSTIPDWVSG